MNKRLEKILEPIVLSGMIAFLGVIFLIDTIDLFLIRPPTRFLKKNLKSIKKLLK